MSTIEATTFIRRSVDDVFAYVGDQHNAVKWQSGLIEVRRLTDGPLGIGARHSFVRRVMGRKVEAQNEYVAYQPNERIIFKTVTGPMQLEASYLTKSSGEGTELTCRMELARGRGFSGLFHPLIVRTIQKEMRANFVTLKEILEARGEASASAAQSSS